MATVNYTSNGTVGGSLGEGLGAPQQAYLEKLMTTEVAQTTIFDRFATIQKSMPQKRGTVMKFRKWVDMKDLVLANTIYKTYTENDIVNAGQGVATMIGRDEYANYILPEGSSGSEFGQMKVVEMQTDIKPIGMWMSHTEEDIILHDMYTVSENVKQYSKVAGFIIDGFYRDLYQSSAGHAIDISGNTAPDNDVTSAAFKSAISKISLQLRLSGAKYVDSVLKQSPNYAKQGIWSRYLGVCNPMMAEALTENPNFKPVEEYPGGVAILDGERGMIGDVRVIENENAFISDNGDGTYKGELLIFGKEHTADIPLRGKKRIQIIVKGLGENGNDILDRVGYIGWKSWLGAYTIHPERLGIVTADFTI